MADRLQALAPSTGSGQDMADRLQAVGNGRQAVDDGRQPSRPAGRLQALDDARQALQALQALQTARRSTMAGRRSTMAGRRSTLADGRQAVDARRWPAGGRRWPAGALVTRGEMRSILSAQRQGIVGVVSRASERGRCDENSDVMLSEVIIVLYM